MENFYQAIVDFESIHPIRFWAGAALILAILILVFKSILKKNNSTTREVHHPPLAIPNSRNNENLNKAKGEEREIVTEGIRPSTYQTNKSESEKPKVEAHFSTNTSKLAEKPLLTPPIPKVQVAPPKPKPKEKLSEAKIETQVGKDSTCYVNYASSKSDQTESYPIFRCPKKGTVVRSYRFGNTKRRGFKEESFQNLIENIFGRDFLVSGSIRLNTGKDTRPFEPDIAIIGKSNNSIRIDIEIDEPYAGLTRQPTHCKGDDLMRDIYFVDRGWIVIRFSELQVHSSEKECIKFIAEMIQSVNPLYDIPLSLNNYESIKTEKMWDVVQAQKWEKAKYREKYLNHTFQHIEEKQETIERDFSEQESNEEKLVKPTLIGVADKRKSIGFNLINTHQRDKRIEFYPEPHIYTIDKTPAPSASTIISKFFPEFDAEYWATRKAPELRMTPNEVAKMWKDKGEKAAQDGTHLHEQIENYFLDQDYKRTEEFHLFEQFIADHKEIKPYRSEWRIFDEHNHIAGTIDLICKNGGSYEIYDWKRSKKVVNQITGEPICHNQWQCGVGQLSDIADTSFNRYCLQQSLYRFILEKNYGLKVSRMNLVVLYPDYDRYYKVEVPYQKEKAEYILRTL
ncbi:PD-(D/E)XK nuclease family protein [Rufibacter sp. XAAS-G3-1]|uniref:PD-(D/E)XK nuclease family protein n=1 Tax=Rufibacter sp. XAAS-G3-1 TaxID=2729134 RepID=UPI0015E711A6|nr:PD-(D/E)XK nuclease family protein [Rufibacter sp. XAAS-G3-1]